jgi:hypothetical protein
MSMKRENNDLVLVQNQKKLDPNRLELIITEKMRLFTLKSLKLCKRLNIQRK